jgi:hypothetical protein
MFALGSSAADMYADVPSAFASAYLALRENLSFLLSKLMIYDRFSFTAAFSHSLSSIKKAKARRHFERVSS